MTKTELLNFYQQNGEELLINKDTKRPKTEDEAVLKFNTDFSNGTYEYITETQLKKCYKDYKKLYNIDKSYNPVIDSEIEAYKSELNSCNTSNKPIDEMSGEELLKFYQDSFHQSYLKWQIKKLEVKKQGIDLLVDYCFPPTTVEDAIKRREMDKKAAEFYASYFKSE